MNTAILSPALRRSPLSRESLCNRRDRWDWEEPDERHVWPSEPAEFDEPSDLELPTLDDAYWDVFIADDDECDPLPDEGDFWIDDPHDASDRSF